MKLRMLLVATTLLAATASPPVVAAGSYDAAWGWVTARNPMSASYTPAARDRGNSTGATNYVEKLDVGVYRVTFPDIYTSGGTSGIPVVTALANTPKYCTAGGWSVNPSTSDALAIIYCYTFDGQATESKFSVLYVIGGGDSGESAYLWADEPSTTSYTPHLSYQFNSSGTSNTIYRSATGEYQANLSNMTNYAGNAQVVAAGDETCRIRNWVAGLSINPVNVRCYSASGDPVDAEFNILFTNDIGMTTVYRNYATHLFANQPTTASYTPPSAYRYSSSGATVVKRKGVGQYVAILYGMDYGGAALVTAVGKGKSRCQLTSILVNDAPQKVGVRCFKVNGDPVDSKFTLTYTK